ncbi:hypothetical protein BOTBODRAFT_174831 [Botryobasidium botryosum FD-172 SS1]|uniref:Methyltransferase domain-containing protein n=1 Tax=Botryobasidium botryosum (strain FD-172 SS1) TaxID=930990 RepID=A0A067MR88_BOTB1|nr:hypothetical protein BOTBODRAFT_174831 [Botryobasidium botryosum FD-172 SS1]
MTFSHAPVEYTHPVVSITLAEGDAGSSSTPWSQTSPARLEIRNGSRTHTYSRRDAPYPLTYDRSLLDFDVWNHEYWREVYGSITLHDFKAPPSRSLDLGCGTGNFVLEAAKMWPECTFVGFDLVDIQPRLGRLDPDLSARIHWVHGNLLERLPFEDDYFDHVRISRIGFGVPENKWEFVLEEAVRVLKPGGAFEMIEENLIFPCGPLPDPDESIIPAPNPSFDSSASINSDDYDGEIVLDESRDPRDHSLIRDAFEAMLSERFINPTPLSILPYYLELYLEGVRSQTPFQFLIPPRRCTMCDSAEDTLSSSHSLSSFANEPEQKTVRLDMLRAPLGERVHPDAPVVIQPYKASSSASMHLGMMYHSVLACKLLLSRQFRKLNPSLRKEDFETLFMSYRFDMEDRMGLGKVVSDTLGWAEPPTEPTYRQRWCALLRRFEDSDPASGAPSPCVCRNVRSFVGWKPGAGSTLQTQSITRRRSIVYVPGTISAASGDSGHTSGANV